MFTKILPGYKNTCVIVGALFILLSLSLFARGLMVSMSEFKVPETVLQSPHYYDAIFWVYLHMSVIGILMIAFGFAVTDSKKQKWITLLFFVITAFYTFLDFKNSDSAFGNGLYKGEASVVPAIFSLIFCFLFFQITIRLFLVKTK